MDNWDFRMLEMAKLVSSWSKDPSTKTGAVIVDQDKRIISVGYNGFPKKIKDLQERYDNREVKYKMIVHCEINAILFAKRDLKGCTLYTYPFMSCERCAGVVIQSGISKCIAPKLPEHLLERWGESVKISTIMFEESGVELKLVDFQIV